MNGEWRFVRPGKGRWNGTSILFLLCFCQFHTWHRDFQIQQITISLNLFLTVDAPCAVLPVTDYWRFLCWQEEKKSFKEKLQSIQDVCLQVQQAMDAIASVGERVKKWVAGPIQDTLWQCSSDNTGTRFPVSITCDKDVATKVCVSFINMPLTFLLVCLQHIQLDSTMVVDSSSVGASSGRSGAVFYSTPIPDTGMGWV